VPFALAKISDPLSPPEVHLAPVGYAVKPQATWTCSQGTGPYLKDNQMLENDFNPLAERSRQSLSATGLIRVTPELVVLDPTPRSRLRWLP
jgi:hypothetical protein